MEGVNIEDCPYQIQCIELTDAQFLKHRFISGRPISYL